MSDHFSTHRGYCQWSRIMAAVLPSLLLGAASFAVAGEYMFVTPTSYPTYTPTDRHEPLDGYKFPKVPVIYSNCWPENTCHDFFVMDEKQLTDKGKAYWVKHDLDLGFSIGANCVCVCRSGSMVSRRWYLWFRWYPKSAHQALDYVFSAIGDTYARDEEGRDGDGAFFRPMPDSTYEQFWDKHKTFLGERIADMGLTKAILWRQYTKVCPKTFTDTLREEFGWEGPNVRPEPNARSLAPAIDLRSGMRLRVDHSIYMDATSAPQSNDPDVAASQLHRGYVNAGTSYYSVSRLPRPYDSKLGTFGIPGSTDDTSVLVLNPFIGQTQQASNQPWLTTPKGHRPNVVASPLEMTLQPRYQMKRHLRLVYPVGGETIEDARLLSTNATGASDLYVQIRNHPAVVSGNVRSDISAKKLFNLLQTATFKLDPVEDPSIYVLRGRAFPIPEIAITVNGNERHVACGTRLRQIAEVHLDSAPEVMARQIQLRRRVDGRLVPVRFRCDKGGMVLEMPLMKGDVVTW